jgi:hypothetical protein
MYEEPVAASADHGLTDDEFRALFPKADYTPPSSMRAGGAVGP